MVERVADFFRPARREEGAAIEVDGAPTISYETLREFPSDAEIAAINDSKNVPVDGARLEIRATDRDKATSGWWARIHDDDRFPKRMDLYPTVEMEDIAGRRFVTADLIVECEGRGENLVPKRIHLISYKGDEDTAAG